MDNRERDQVSKRSSPTEAGELNRKTSEESGREHNRGTDAEFGQSIGRSENLSEGGVMKDRNRESMESDLNSEMKRDKVSNQSEPSRRQGSGEFGSSKGRSGSLGSNPTDVDRNNPRSRTDRGSDISGDENIGNRSSRDESSGRH